MIFIAYSNVSIMKKKFLENSMFCKILLSFAAGSLLGDIFFHLLPEASQSGHFFLFNDSIEHF